MPNTNSRLPLVIPLPEPTYLWHEGPQDEHSGTLYHVPTSGRVDQSEAYAGGVCKFCVPLFTAEQVEAHALNVLSKQLGEPPETAPDDPCLLKVKQLTSQYFAATNPNPKVAARLMLEIEMAVTQALVENRSAGSALIDPT